MMQYLFKKISILVALAAVLTLAACGGGGGTSDPVAANKPTKATTILIFGDSISQGYGTNVVGVEYKQVTPGRTYAELLRAKIQQENIGQFAPVTVINASLGSEYTDEAAYRLPGLLAQYQPNYVLLAHGTNDAGSDVPNSVISNNLNVMINQVYAAGAKPLLADVTFTRYGVDVANAYSKMIVDLTASSGATYVGLLNGVLGNPAYYLADGVHLNDAAQPFMLNNLWAKLDPLFN
jgi:acyl-CoA thioesterase I